MKRMKKSKHQALLYKLDKVQSLNLSEIAVLQQENNASFLPFSVQEDKKATTLVFPTELVVGLPDFLAGIVLSKRLFLQLLRQFLRVSKAVELNRLNRNLVVFDMGCIYIEPESWQLRFLYMPVQPIDIPGTCRTALQGLIHYATFDPNEDLSYVQTFIQLVSSDSLFSLLALEQFVENHGAAPRQQADKTCPQCGFSLGAADRECPVCGKKLGDSAPMSPKAAPRFGPGQGQYSVREDENGGIAVFRLTKASGPKVTLRGKLGDIPIKRSPFRLGKQADIVDHCVPNNAVSRRHMELCIEGSACYAVDLNSTNGTFLNGRRLPAGSKAPLKNGDILMLGNEKFMVIVED